MKCPQSLRLHKSGHMKKLAAKYKKQGVVWLAIDSTSRTSAKELEAFRKKYSVSYPILMDTDGSVAKRFHARTTPHMFVVKNGVKVYEGALDNDPEGKNEKAINYVAQALNEALVGKPVTVAHKEPYGSAVKPAAMKEEDGDS